MSDEPQTDEQEQAPAGKASREAARWRTRVREVETERDTLRATVQAFQRAEVERLAADSLADVSDLWTLGEVEVDALLTEDGTVDQSKVESAVAALVERKPHLSVDGPPVGSFDGGVRGPSTSAPTATWSGLLSGRTGVQR